MVKTIYVPYADESLDTLNRTLTTLESCPLPIVVIDNSYTQRLSTANFLSLTPPVPLTLWQTLWMLCQQREPFLWTQCDAVITRDAVSRLIDATNAQAEPWGVIFTHYDILSALNAPELVARDVLPDLNLPHYHGDPDWYRRMRLAGLRMVDVGGDDVHHAPGGGGHWRNNHARDTARQCMDSGRYYREKWGGDIGQERYNTPWNE